MARVTTSTRFRTDSDAAFREMVSLIETNMAAAGLVRTADTGQINPATVIRTTNTDVGYSMWRFDDALQSVAPIFIKVTYRIPTNVNWLVARIGIGTSTSGAGALTGTFVESNNLGSSYSSTVDTLYDSYFTHSNGFFGMALAVGLNATYNNPLSFNVQRTVDNNGSPTAEGAVLVCGGQQNAYASTFLLRFVAPPSSATATAAYAAMIPANISNSRVGLDPQVFMHWTALPKQKPLVGTAAYIDSEINEKTQFSIALVGVTPRNYLALGRNLGNAAYATANTGMVMLWED